MFCPHLLYGLDQIDRERGKRQRRVTRQIVILACQRIPRRAIPTGQHEHRESGKTIWAASSTRTWTTIAQLEEALERTANVFVLAQDGDGAWPYLYRQSEGRKVTKKVSHGTQAMIAVALSRMIGSGVLASAQYAQLKLTDRDDVRVSYALGVKKLVKELDGNLRSGSFGLNDPVTLSHFADFIHALSEADPCGEMLKGISKAIDELNGIAGLDPRTASTRQRR